MARRWIPRFLALAVVAAAAWWWQQRRDSAPSLAEPERLAPTRAEPLVQPAAPVAPDASWCTPTEGICPDGFPVKVARSGIFHEPGGRSYERTVPERCYATAADAEADGYRRAKA